MKHARGSIRDHSHELAESASRLPDRFDQPFSIQRLYAVGGVGETMRAITRHIPFRRVRASLSSARGTGMNGFLSCVVSPTPL